MCHQKRVSADAWSNDGKSRMVHNNVIFFLHMPMFDIWMCGFLFLNFIYISWGRGGRAVMSFPRFSRLPLLCISLPEYCCVFTAPFIVYHLFDLLHINEIIILHRNNDTCFRTAKIVAFLELREFPVIFFSL